MDYLRALVTALSPSTWRRIGVIFVGFLLPTYVFIELADDVRDNETLFFDETILQTIHTISSPILDTVVIALTELGGVIGVTTLTTGIALLLLIRERRKMAIRLLVGVGGGVLLNLFLKAIFQRDRPQLWERLVTENSFSFPSGHAMASSALAFSLVLVFWPTRWRWVVVAGAVMYTILIGFSRLYLGVHYPTDIVAGWMVSAGWVTVVGLIIGHKRSAAVK